MFANPFSRYGGGLMLKGEYVPFQYVVVYVAVMQVCSGTILETTDMGTDGSD